MHITRREFVAGASALVLAGSAVLGSISSAFADPTPEELARPGPLPDLVQGKADAPITIIEYASMTCPHCAAFHKTTYPALKTRYIDTGKVRFIFREYPLDEVAVAASMIARCAGGDKKLEDQVAQSRLTASQLGVDATPTFFINGKKFDGAPTAEAFDKALSGAAAKS